MLETSSESPVPVRVISEAIGAYLGKLGAVWVEGELSEITVRPGAPMVFMRLRDTSADMSISVMCHKSVLETVHPLPQNARVIMYSKVSWYSKSGSISLSVREIRKVGVGELLARLEHLKSVLASEGLFDISRKKVLPFLPNAIGLICGRNSDAEKDVIENARRRWPAVRFEVREVAVQGSAAVIEVSAALLELDANPEVEVIIITRGGGSFEDLLPFSDEGLIRLVAAASTPIISAIGHEKDSPLLDLVADWRASTPTDAGKKVVPDMLEELQKITHFKNRSYRNLLNRIEFEESKVNSLIDRPALRDPHLMITFRHDFINFLHRRIFISIWNRITLAHQDISNLEGQVRTLSPQATLDRGYAVVQKVNGDVIRNSAEITTGDSLRIRFSLGELQARAE
jgi:exodeoxyribonuclease VII large subunit